MSRKPQITTTAPLSLTASMAMNRSHLDAMAKIGAKFATWRPAAEVLTKVRAVETIFPQLDAMLRVGGWPIERFGLVHGPSNEGKTSLLHGLGKSFLLRGHFYAYVDAEYTTPDEWIQQSLMQELSQHPGFVALRPSTYEQTVDAVRDFCTNIGDAKAKGELAPETSGLVVIDSLRKLVPKDLLSKIMKGAEQEEQQQTRGRRKQGKRGVDGAGGRAAMIKAAMNAAWLDEVVPMLAQTGTAMIVVARESENVDAGSWGDDFHVQGGKSVNYDSSVVLRVMREKWLHASPTDSQSPVIGERLCVELRKTKVGEKDNSRPRCHINISNGTLVPRGFDRARDVVELALEYDILTLHGSWIAYGARRLGQGEHNTVKKLTGDPELCLEIETKARAASVVAGVGVGGAS